MLMPVKAFGELPDALGKQVVVVVAISVTPRPVECGEQKECPPHSLSPPAT